MQDFGRAGDDAIGIISLPYEGLAGQIFTLDITPPGYPNPVWHLEPLQQVGPWPIRESIFVAAFGGQSVLNEVQAWATTGPDRTWLLNGLFAVPESGDGSRFVPLFFLVDKQGDAFQVTQEQYQAAGGATGRPGTVGPFLIAPTYPPTPTVRGIPTSRPPNVVCP